MLIWLAAAGATVILAVLVFAMARVAKDADERAEALFREQLLGRRRTDPDEIARARARRRRGSEGHGA